MYSASNDQKFRELFYHTIFNSMVALLKKTKEIKEKEDKERKSQKDINKKENKENQEEENVVNQEKVDNTEEQNSQSIDTSKLDTQPIQKEEQTDQNKDKTEEK